MKKIIASTFTLGIVALSPAIAYAHVVVKPAQVGIGAFQTFQTGVPNEKDDVTVTGLKLVMPSGLNYVSPNVKPGWDINVVKDGETVTEIDWTNGSIPAGQRDEFDFSAQTPAKATELDWKAYQTYSDGSVVAWDQTPDPAKKEGTTPYSVTKVVNDLTTTAATTATPVAVAKANDDSKNNLSLLVGTVGVVLGAASLLVKRK